MKDNLIYKFLVETVNRLLAKSSQYVKIIQVLALGCTLVTGLPAFLEFLGVQNLPTWFAGLENKIIYVAGLIGAFLLQLEVPKDVVKTEAAYKSSLAPIVPVKDVKLPFSDAVQK